MPRKTAGRRATQHADFAGPDAAKEAIEKLAKSAAEANAKAGHNSGEVPDETIARHVDLIKAAEIEWREARDKAAELQGVLRNRYKVAKGDGVDIDSLKLAFRIAERASGEVVSEQRNVGRYLRIMGSPLGTQWSLFDGDAGGEGKAAVGALDAELQGQAAWRNKEPPENNPFTPGTENFVQWATGYGNAEAAALQQIGRGNGEAAAH